MASLHTPRPRQNFLPHILKGPKGISVHKCFTPPITCDQSISPNSGGKAERSASGALLSGARNLDKPTSGNEVFTKNMLSLV